jgi:alpha-glucoside transport system substrate-binding protein
MGKRNLLTLMVATILVAAACGSPTATTTPTQAPESMTPTTAPESMTPTTAPESMTPTTAPESMAPAVPTVPTGYAALDQALDPSKPFAGKTVDIQTQWIGGEGANFAASVADFQAATGIVLNIEGVGTSHETVLKTRIDGGAPPDLAMLAQPSGVDAYGAQGKLVDLGAAMTADEINKLNTEHPATIGLVTVGSHVWGIPYKVDVKSVVWYPIKAFAAAGYQVPQTWQDLIDLSNKIVADGNGNPWCIGMEAGTATGWQATDWLEEVELKTQGVDWYNKTITHEVTFQDPGVVNAMDNYLAKIFFTPDYVYGGYQAIIATHQTDPMDPMFPPASAGDNWDGFTPGCWMQKQATWYGPDFFPDKKASSDPNYVSQYILGQDIGLFEFPVIDPTLGQVVEGSGDTLMIPAPADGSAVRPEVLATAEFLSTPQGTQAWIAAGSATSANQTTPQSWYDAAGYKAQVSSQIISSAKGFGFDASDLMPPSVGQGTEWSDLSEWINGGGQNPSTADTLKAIDDSWPSQ